MTTENISQGILVFYIASGTIGILAAILYIVTEKNRLKNKSKHYESWLYTDDYCHDCFNRFDNFVSNSL